MQAPSVSTTVYHLEMLDRARFAPKACPAGFEAALVAPPDPEVNAAFYRNVGAPWNWTDRLSWPRGAWRRYVDRVALRTWVGRLHDQPVGYFELETQDEGNVQIAYFGLLPAFIGQGLGGPLLSAAVGRAWDTPGARRVWLHTCTHDHPRALDNYRKRGFAVFRTENVPQKG